MSSFDKPKVIAAMSGGVDSSVAALLLKEQGFHVEGLFMKNWEEDDTQTYCHAEEDIKDAKSVCDRLGIVFHTVNFAAEYWDKVFTDFLKEYAAGRTPNPDILCNKEIKFKLCLNFAADLGADSFATGHYAQNVDYQLREALDLDKDQTYFMYTLTQDILKKVCFPIGCLQKSQVRKIAQENGFLNYAKKDSTGVCFIGERRFRNFLQRYLPAKPGVIETLEGRKIGAHQGLMYYTAGQRQGMNIGGQREGTGKAWYVARKDLKRNVLIVVQGHDHPALLSEQLLFEQANWIYPSVFPLECSAKIRYRQKAQPCRVEKFNKDSYKVVFKNPQWAIAPGQSVVFYQKNLCLGGGVIIENLKPLEN